MSTPPSSASVGVIAGAGSLPFAVAESLRGQGRTPVLYAIRGFCDAARVTAYRHHWVALGQVGRLTRLLRVEGCRDVLFIGGLVRPGLSEIRLDWGTLKVIPSIAAALRGGDDHLLTGIARIFEQHGFRLVGVQDIAPDLLMPAGALTRATPDVAARADIDKGLAALHAMSPFDIGQALVVIDGHVVAVEDIEGTDGLLARVARLRDQGRIRAKAGTGVLIKAPKSSQDLRFDLPTVGPRTIEGAIAAGLRGVAITAGRAIVAEPQAMIASADKAGLFVTGVAA
ncbi:LpxI family protein [Bradyrhizobium sp. 2TAF24]|uniref:LpxI family protein n=1 Tax=Bradyrhizobium sp. 2TAF24 TaxID=3233011 RepID=UPI003F91D4A9